MTYNRIRHVELLKCSQDMEKQRKSLSKENPEDYLELLRYQVEMEEHTF